MAAKIAEHLRSNVIAYLALFVALSGSAYAASHINGKTIRKHSLPGNRIKKNSVTGKQVNESKLGTVPSATSAMSATTADTATNANALGGTPPSGFGSGVVSGAVYDPGNGSKFFPPYGYFDATTDKSVEAIAPVAITVRDFVGEAASGFSSGSLAFSLEINAQSVSLCTVSGMQTTCRVNGPVTIPKDAQYRLETVGTGLGAAATIGFQYRAAAG